MTAKQLLTAATIVLYTAAVPLAGIAEAKGSAHGGSAHGHASSHAAASAHGGGGKGGKSGGGGNPFATAQSIMGLVGGVFGR